METPSFDMPQREADLTLPKDGNSYKIKIWLNEKLFWIDNSYLKERECIGRIRAQDQYYDDPIKFLEALLVIDMTGVKRKELVMTFLVERGLFDATE
jgi:hypothetical protein